VEGDRDRIVQVLSNLLSNAIKFTNQGEISINLSEKIRDEGDRENGVFITVTERSSGMNSEIFTRLFSKFGSKSYTRHWFRIVYLQKYYTGPR
jgi:signal transduction histidine kinase